MLLLVGACVCRCFGAPAEPRAPAVAGLDALDIMRRVAEVTAVWTRPAPANLSYWSVYGASESDGKRKRVHYVRYKHPHRLAVWSFTNGGLCPVIVATDEHSARFLDERNPHQRRVGRELALSYLRGTWLDLALDPVCAHPERFRLRAAGRAQASGREATVIEVEGEGLMEHVGLGADHRQCSAMARKLLLHVDATRFVPLEMEVWDGEGLHATWTFSDYVSVGGCLAPRLVVWRIAKRKETFGHTWEFRFRFQTIGDAVWLLKRGENVHGGKAVRYLELHGTSLEPIPDWEFIERAELHKLTGDQIRQARREMGEEARRINCASHLKNFALSSRMYSGDHDGRFPDDLLGLYAGDYLRSFQMWTCPATDTKPASSLAELRSGEHCDYLYFGGGVTEECMGHDPAKTVLGCDRPGNHRGFLNVWFANGRVKGYSGESIEEIVLDNGLFLPGHTLEPRPVSRPPGKP